MPAYNYRCITCGQEDTRLGGLDDSTALCVECGGLALRTDEDVFAPLFYEAQLSRAALTRFRLGMATGRRDLEEQK